MASSDEKLIGAWKSLMAGGAIPGDVRPTIRESWQRVYGRLSHDSKPPVVTESEERVQGRWEPLMSAPIPYLSQLDMWAKDAHCLVALTTEHGILSKVCGDWRVQKKAAKAIHFIPGADYSETAAGTNAIGTALASGQAINVRGAEHFIVPFHEWVCAAVPIWDRTTGQLLGTVDITGPRDNDLRQSMESLIQLLGTTVGDSWYVATSEQRQWLQTQFSRYAIRYANDTLWLLDTLGGVLMSQGATPSPADHRALQDFIRASRSTGTLPSGFWCDLLPLRRGDAIGGWIAICPGEQAHPRVSTQPWHARYDRHDLIGAHPSYMRLIQQIEQVAPTTAPILLCGETGVGKERVAHALHQASLRAQGPFVAVNCGAIPEDLIGPELFGYEGGAFTGAKPDGSPGKFEAAHNGTIFLDEIGELPLAMQPYLLRVLETRELVRVGGRAPMPLDVRIIAATHHDLRELAMSASFRLDLYYRLAIIELGVPPLRERTSDISLLSRYFLKEISASVGQAPPEVTDPALRVLMRYSWPGNLRELRNVLYRCAIFSGGTAVTPELLYQCAPFLAPDPILKAVEQHAGNMQAIAQELGVSRSTLYRRLKKSGQVLS